MIGVTELLYQHLFFDPDPAALYAELLLEIVTREVFDDIEGFALPIGPVKFDGANGAGEPFEAAKSSSR